MRCRDVKRRNLRDVYSRGTCSSCTSDRTHSTIASHRVYSHTPQGTEHRTTYRYRSPRTGSCVSASHPEVSEPEGRALNVQENRSVLTKVGRWVMNEVRSASVATTGPPQVSLGPPLELEEVWGIVVPKRNINLHSGSTEKQRTSAATRLFSKRCLSAGRMLVSAVSRSSGLRMSSNIPLGGSLESSSRALPLSRNGRRIRRPVPDFCVGEDGGAGEESRTRGRLWDRAAGVASSTSESSRMGVLPLGRCFFLLFDRVAAGVASPSTSISDSSVTPTVPCLRLSVRRDDEATDDERRAAICSGGSLVGCSGPGVGWDGIGSSVAGGAFVG